MKASKCTCGSIYVFDRVVCPECGKGMEQVDIAGDAEVLTHTTLHFAPEGFEAPIRMVLVRFGEGAMLLCQSREEGDLEIGRKGRVEEEGGKYWFKGE